MMSGDPYATCLSMTSPPRSIIEQIESVRSLLRPAYDINGDRVTFSLQENLTHGVYLVESLRPVHPWKMIREAMLDDYNTHMDRLSGTPAEEVREEHLPLWMHFDNVVLYLAHTESRICPFHYIRY